MQLALTKWTAGARVLIFASRCYGIYSLWSPERSESTPGHREEAAAREPHTAGGERAQPGGAPHWT